MFDWFIGIFIVLVSTGIIHEYITGEGGVHVYALIFMGVMLLLLLWSWFYDKFIKHEDEGWGGGP